MMTNQCYVELTPTSEVLTEEGSQVVGKLAGDTAGALVGSGVKGGENWAREQDNN